MCSLFRECEEMCTELSTEVRTCTPSQGEEWATFVRLNSLGCHNSIELSTML